MNWKNPQKFFFKFRPSSNRLASHFIIVSYQQGWENKVRHCFSSSGILFYNPFIWRVWRLKQFLTKFLKYQCITNLISNQWTSVYFTLDSGEMKHGQTVHITEFITAFSHVKRISVTIVADNILIHPLTTVYFNLIGVLFVEST